MASDLIAPIVIMVLLFILNGIVIFYIHRAKKNDFRQTRSSKYNTQPEMGRVSYGSMDNNISSLRAKSLKLGMKNWALSLSINNEKRILKSP